MSSWWEKLSGSKRNTLLCHMVFPNLYSSARISFFISATRQVIRLFIVFVLMNVQTWTPLSYSCCEKDSIQTRLEKWVNASDQVTQYPLAMHLVSDKGKDYSLPLYIKEWPVEIWFTTVFGFLLYSNTSQIEEDFKSIKAEEYVLFYPLDLQVRHRQMDHSHPKKWIKGWQLSSNDCGSSRIRQTVNMTYWTWREQWMLLLLAYPDWTLC